MTIAEMVLEKLRQLPPEKQKVVLDFLDSLQPIGPDRTSGKPVRSLEGLWKDLDIQISEEDIAEARREMWGSFPRETS